MPQSNIIVNGTFALGNTGWGGTDLETSYTENAYLGNGSTNRVAELDGFANQTTIMTQSIEIDRQVTRDLTFRTALRTASLSNAGTEGFKIEIVDAENPSVIIATQTYFPTSTSWVTNTLTVNFPAGGTYIIRMTELGKDDSLGAIIDDVSMLVCFTAGSLIDTANGPRAVETLRPGELVWTLDAGMQPIRWIGKRTVSLPDLLADPTLRPIRFAAGALGAGMPHRPMALSPQHRVCLGGWQAELHFGLSEVLISAQSLINGTTIVRAEPVSAVTYVHFMLDGHQIVQSDGILSESFFPTTLSLTGLDGAARAEVLRLFPDLASLTRAYPQTARPVLRGAEARLVA